MTTFFFDEIGSFIESRTNVPLSYRWYGSSSMFGCSWFTAYVSYFVQLDATRIKRRDCHETSTAPSFFCMYRKFKVATVDAACIAAGRCSCPIARMPEHSILKLLEGHIERCADASLVYTSAA